MLDALRAAAEHDEQLAAWLKGLDDPGAPVADVVLPETDDLPDVLLDLAVPHEDINALLGLRARILGDPDARWLLARCVGALLRDLGRPETEVRLPVLPASLGDLGSCFHVFVFVAALPDVRAYHRRHGIPDDVSRRTLADLGRHMAVHRRRHGTRGVPVPGWHALHFRGELYQLGRLQFQRAVLGERMAADVAASGIGARAGDPCLSVHIPDFLGPMSDAACERSVEWAREFFPRHFPGERHDVVVCHSWLLDPQLKRYLPGAANIVRFQERFRLAGTYAGQEPDDRLPVGFVFGDRDLEVATLPRRTRVERAVGDHLRGGGHWYEGHGWFPLERPQSRPFP
ncbi:acyltransferase domain-containing protein [Streptomyces alboflavus]|uniref:acyltransferase domain-containing protein n=1 Tax=Streptomyces alboflavus TaxID=67267 RepID=UPI000524F65C|nr:acyltransferase domain-containing protein [Streptomyces alboflavus]